MINGIDGHDENFQSCSPCSTINANGGGALFNDGGNVTLNDVAFNGNATSANPLGGADQQRLRHADHDRRLVHGQQRSRAEARCSSRGGNVNGVGVTFENNGSGDFDGGAAYLLGGTVNLTNATIVGNGCGFVDRRRDRERRRDLDAGQRHVLGQHPRRDPNRSGRHDDRREHDHRRRLCRRQRLRMPGVGKVDRPVQQQARRRRDHQRRGQQLRPGRALRLRRQRRHRRRRPAPRLDRRQRRADAHAGAARRQPGDRRRQSEPTARQPTSATSPATAMRHRRVRDPPDSVARDPDHQRGRPTSPTRAPTSTARSTSRATPEDSTSSGACRRTTCSTRPPSKAPASSTATPP